MATLTISHNIFLTREQRYDLNNDITIKVVGASVPVILSKNKISSEPAKEVFVYYTIKTSNLLYINYNMVDGYEIEVCKSTPYKTLPDNFWQTLTPHQKKIWYVRNEPNPSVHDILDINDGGKEWLAFRQIQTIKKENKNLEIIHYIEIKKIETLLESLS